MNSSPLVSVCIANYNGETILNECIDSILGQDYKNFEIIVHDDNSTDNSLDILKVYQDKVTIIKSDENVGFCISNNRMVDAANGQYLLLFNNDALLEETGISSLISAIEQGNFGILTLVQKDYLTNEIIDSGRDLDIFLNPIPREKEKNAVQSVMTVHGACLFISTDLWYKLGCFPTFFKSVAEDLFICLEAIANGFEVGSVNTSYYLHRNGHSFGGGGVGDTGLNTSYNRRYLSERNRLLIMQQLFPGLFKSIIYFQIIVLLSEGVILSLIKLNKNILTRIYFKAIVDFFKLKKSFIGRKLSNQLPNKFIWNLEFIPYKLSLLVKYGIPEIK